MSASIGSRIRRWKGPLKYIVTGLVVVGLVWMVRGSWSELSASSIRLGEIRWHRLLVAAACYGLGMLTAAAFWHGVLARLGLQVAAGRAYSAFFLSQLGKYLPGKAMVIVLRVAAIRAPGVNTQLAVVSVFVETLTWMAVGAAVGCLALSAIGRATTWIVMAGGLVALFSIVAVSPPCLRRVLGWLRPPDPREAELPVNGLTWRFLFGGWLLLALGWMLVGASLWWVVAAFPEAPVRAADFPLMMACAGLSVVLGFASLIPGGLGVRELVIMPLLAGPFGAPVALGAAVLARLVWMGTELLLAAIMKAVSWRRHVEGGCRSR